MDGIFQAVRQRWLTARPFDQLQAWVDLMLRADECGSLWCTQAELAAEWGWSYAAVRRFLDAAQTDNLLRKIRHGKKLEISMQARLNQPIGEHLSAQSGAQLTAHTSEGATAPRSSSDLLASLLRRDPLNSFDFSSLLARGATVKIEDGTGCAITVTDLQKLTDTELCEPSAGEQRLASAAPSGRSTEQGTDTERQTEANRHRSKDSEDKTGNDAAAGGGSRGESLKGLPPHHQRVREYAFMLKREIDFYDKVDRRAMGLHINVAQNAAAAVADPDCELSEGDISSLLQWARDKAIQQAKLVRMCFIGGLKSKFADIGREYQGGRVKPHENADQQRRTEEERRAQLLAELAAMEERA